MKVFVAGLGNNMTWKKLPSDEEPDHTFVDHIEEQVFDLVGKVRSDKAGGTTGHIGLVITPLELALIPGTTPFTQESHPGAVDYLLPTACTTIQQHTERRYDNAEQLHVFEMEQKVDEQMKGHIFSCFNPDAYVDLKKPRIGYTNITTTEVHKYPYREYSEKTEELQNKVLDDLDKETDITGSSIKPFRLKHEKLKLFLEPTKQAISDGMYVKKCLRVIKKFNCINKIVLTWRARPLNQQTVVLFWPFFTAAHKKQRLKLLQENEQANSVMLQKIVKDMALKISQPKQYTDQQQCTVNDLVDKVNNNPSIRSRSDQSIPGMIETSGTPSTVDSSELSTAQALTTSLTSSLAETKRNCYQPWNKQGPGRGGNRAGGRGGRGGNQ